MYVAHDIMHVCRSTPIVLFNLSDVNVGARRLNASVLRSVQLPQQNIQHCFDVILSIFIIFVPAMQRTGEDVD